MAKLKPLIQLVSETINSWMSKGQEQGFASTNEWLTGREGKVYLRYVFSVRRHELDIANIELKKLYRGKGIARELIELACNSPIPIIKIELIHNEGWAEKVRQYQFPNRETTVTDVREGAISVYFKLVENRPNPSVIWTEDP